MVVNAKWYHNDFNHLVRRLVCRVVEVEFLGTGDIHDNIEQQELAGSQRTNHDTPGSETDSTELEKSDLRGDIK